MVKPALHLNQHKSGVIALDSTALSRTYLAAVQDGGLEAVVALFAPTGQVHSPLYGQLPAREFYSRLFADTSRSQLTMRGVLEGSSAVGTPLVGLWFHFDWMLKSGEPAPFEVVDILELDASGRITNLHIIYDTAGLRAAFERSTSSPG
jgi:steroid delta-isomerase